MSSRLRWQIANLLDRLPGQCYAGLASWAAGLRRGVPWSRTDWACRSDLERNGSCFCCKLRKESTS